MLMIHGNLEVIQVVGGKALRDIWPKIREGFLAIEDKCDGLHHLPEDVYHEIKTDRLKLLVASVGGKYEGFAIIQINQDPDGERLHIWALHHAGRNNDFIANLSGVINDLADIIGAVRISCNSSRIGWLKHYQQHGYTLTGTLHYFERG